MHKVGFSSPQPRPKTRSLAKSPSNNLSDYFDREKEQKIPLAALTTAYKLYGKGSPLSKEDSTFRMLAGEGQYISVSKISDLLNKPEPYEKGKTLKDEGVEFVYQNFQKQDGKLTFEYLMKMGANCGVTITEKMAKTIIKKYGHRKDHLDLEDCKKIQRRQRKSKSRSNSKNKV